MGGQSTKAGLTAHSLLLDIGGYDSFNAKSFAQGFGGGGLALFINIFGIDNYSGKGKDWSLWTQGYFGIGIDMGGFRKLAMHGKVGLHSSQQ